MQDWVALLKGVNVGGNNKVPMAELRAIAAGLGWQDARTYVASGNLMFRAGSGDHARTLRAAMAAQMGVDVPVLIRSGPALRADLAACPWPDAPGKAVHLFWCWSPPVIDAAALDRFRAPSEALVADADRLWLHAPEGIGRSVLAAKLDKVVTGTDLTARNLNTLRALVGMLDDTGAV
jgi:uncharacterized protein (DUF1697 family)